MNNKNMYLTLACLCSTLILSISASQASSSSLSMNPASAARSIASGSVAQNQAQAKLRLHQAQVDPNTLASVCVGNPQTIAAATKKAIEQSIEPALKRLAATAGHETEQFAKTVTDATTRITQEFGTQAHVIEQGLAQVAQAAGLATATVVNSVGIQTNQLAAQITHLGQTVGTQAGSAVTATTKPIFFGIAGLLCVWTAKNMLEQGHMAGAVLSFGMAYSFFVLGGFFVEAAQQHPHHA